VTQEETGASPAPPKPSVDPEELLRRAEDGVSRLEKRELLEGHERDQMAKQARRLSRLERLLEISRSLSSTLVLSDLLARLMDAVLETSQVERGFLMLFDRGGELRIEIARNIDSGSLMSEDFRPSRSLVYEVAEKGETIWIRDVYEHPEFREQKSVLDLQLRTMIGLPLRLGKRVLGVLYLDSQRVSEMLSPEGIDVLEALAAHAAVAIENARLHEEVLRSKLQLEMENKSLRRVLRNEFRFDAIIGRSPAMQRVFEVMEKVVSTDLPVLIEGETGTGKELIARALHFNGPRREKNLVALNCGALPEPLLESQLFGHRRGAFTGAIEDHAGVFEAADGGTIFLDEVGEMPLSLQVKLLRVLQSGEFTRVGENVVRRSDVRVLSATNKVLSSEVVGGRFREDLFYRLNVVSIRVPPLRERGEDILLLADYFLTEAAKRQGHPVVGFTPETRRFLLHYGWRGNVRELQNCIESALAMSDGRSPLGPELFPHPGPGFESALREGSLRSRLDRFEKVSIREALEANEWNISRAARTLSVSRQHLHNRINRFGLQRRRTTVPRQDS
jgi:transcriptional regulator with GAF, ATPase, and Fis domain